MNKVYVLFAILSIGCLSLISAYDVAYVVKYPDNLDSNELAVKDLLTYEGYEVHIKDDVNFDASAYDFVLVSERVTNIQGIFDNSYVKTIFMSRLAAEKQGISFSSGETTGRKIFIENNNEIVTENFPWGEISVYSPDSKIKYLWGCLALNSISLVHKIEDDKKIVLLLLDENSLLIDGSCTKRNKKIYQRNLFFGLSDANAWNSNAKRLFLNSINWIVGGTDSDGDGYLGNEDCNDKDSSVYPGAEELLDDIDQNCVNDAPVITKEINPITLKEGEDFNNVINLNDYFSDPDGDDLVFSVYSISDNRINVLIENGSVSFSLGEWSGSEEIIFKASDGEKSILSKNVILSSKDSGICPEQEGYFCTSEQICGGNWLDVGNRCCSVTCSLDSMPEFNGINGRFDNITNDIKINIRNPNKNEIFSLGKTLDVRIEIENKIKDRLDFDVGVYLYDINEDKVIESVDSSIDLDENERRFLDVSVDVDENIDVSHNYAVFVMVNDEDEEYYNEGYVRINFERSEHEVIIDKVTFNPEVISCGDSIEVGVRLFNIGENDENFYVRLINSELGIDEKSKEALIGKYNEYDSKITEFNVVISENAKNGEYVLRAGVYYDDKNFFFDKTLVLGECNDQEVEVIEDMNIEPVKVKKSSFGWQIGLLIGSLVVLIALIITLLIFRRQSS